MAVENESEAPAHTIKVEAGKRYILVMEFPDNVSTEYAYDISRNAKENLDRWQHSDDQFLVVALWGGTKLRVERTPDDND